MQILEDHVDKLHIVAKELMEKEKISGERFKLLMSEGYDPTTDKDSPSYQPPVADREPVAE